MQKTMLVAVLLTALAAGVWAQRPAGPAQPAKAPPLRPGVPAAPGAPPAPRAQAAKPASSAADSTRRDDEQAIRLTVDAMVVAYNAGDAKAIAAMFTPEAVVFDENGHTTQGREAIEESFAETFRQHPKSHLDVAITSIRFVSPGVALEDGTSTVVNAPDASPRNTSYSVVHVKLAGKWLMASARDLENEEATAQSELDQLGWLVGEWVDESPDGLVRTKYGWTDNHVYLVSEFNMQVGGQTALSGTQRLCWDPLIDKVRSWVFDSEGGFSQGTWTRHGNEWIVKLSGVTRDGRAGSATHIIRRLSADKYSWQARDRVVGDEITPDTQEIVVVRRPPGPESPVLPSK